MCCKIFKLCLTILARYALKDQRIRIQLRKIIRILSDFLNYRSKCVLQNSCSRKLKFWSNRVHWRPYLEKTQNMLPAKYSEVAFCRCFVKNVFFKRFLKVHRETPVLGTFLIKKHDCNGLSAYKCQRAGYQFNQRFILKIQRVLVSHKLKDHGDFWPHLKIDETTFSFPDFVPACKKSFYSISSFLRYSKF